MAEYIGEGCERHPLSALFGDMSDDEFSGLVGDIRENGQKDAVVLYQGKILDGWHRYRGCLDATQNCRAVQYQGDSPAKFVISKNIHRRTLTASQRAAAIVAAAQWAESGAQDRGGEPGSPPPETVGSMAADAGVSDRTVQQAKKAHEAGLGGKVASGELSAKAAAQKADEQAGKPPKPKPPTEVEKARAEADELRVQLAEMSQRLEDMATLMEASMAATSEEREREQMFLQVARERDVLKSQCNEHMNEATEWKREAKRLKRQLDRLTRD